MANTSLFVDLQKAEESFESFFFFFLKFYFPLLKFCVHYRATVSAVESNQSLKTAINASKKVFLNNKF